MENKMNYYNTNILFCGQISAFFETKHSENKMTQNFLRPTLSCTYPFKNLVVSMLCPCIVEFPENKESVL